MRPQWNGLLVFVLTGCATASGPAWLSPLGQAVTVQPLNRLSLRQDDAACLAWARATKGKGEPFPTAEMRYGVCMVARGYNVQIGDEPRGARVALPAPRPLEDVMHDMQGCRVDKAAIGEFDWGPELIKGRRAIQCLADHGYTIMEIERRYPQDQRDTRR